MHHSIAKSPRIAVFVTPHGFGHATRTVAVLTALQKRIPNLHIELLTTVPHHIFTESLKNITIHEIACDIGFVQSDALTNDIEATITALGKMFPYTEQLLDELSEKISGCNGVYCDITPMGIATAQRAGIPSILVENFTWDWIYTPYISLFPELKTYVEMISDLYRQADFHIQCTPICSPVSSTFQCNPIGRSTRKPKSDIRKKLAAFTSIENRKIILISLGGMNFSIPNLHRFSEMEEYLFILAGQPEFKENGTNCISLPHDSGFFHPDLIHAADLVISKSGYSTAAECFYGNTPLLCIDRPDFAESAVLMNFIQKNGGDVLSQDDFNNGNWLKLIPQMISAHSVAPQVRNGADQAAEYIQSHIFGDKR